jgi:hypothetical protein
MLRGPTLLRDRIPRHVPVVGTSIHLAGGRLLQDLQPGPAHLVSQIDHHYLRLAISGPAIALRFLVAAAVVWQAGIDRVSRTYLAVASSVHPQVSEAPVADAPALQV